MNLKGVSLTKSKNINQAVEIYKKHKKFEKTSDIINFCIKDLIEIGWGKIESGDYKICLYKNSIVAKFPRVSCHSPLWEENTREVRREWEQYSMAPSDFKKYLPKIYFYDRVILIQDVVFNKCKDFKCDAPNIAKKYPIYDWDHNHGHSKKGVVKFFDWVYNRCGTYIYEDIPIKY